MNRPPARFSLTAANKVTNVVGACLTAWFGLFVSAASERVPWTSSKIVGSPEPPARFKLEAAFPLLKFSSPVELVSAPGSDRLFLMELNGKVFSFANRADVTQTDLLIDLKAAIPGVHQSYGMAFHPGFATNRYVYLCFVLKPKLPDSTRVSRFKVTDTNPPTIDPASETILVTWLSGGHNGGSLQFGPDGMLYISAGDSESPSPPDPLNTGQDISDLLSSVLRIDVNHTDAGRPYRVPTDNPFISTPGARPEVWAYGFRNPWKMSFDRVTGSLWVGDVGWDVWELVFRVERGGNYGWSIMEGSQPIKPDAARGPTPIQPPVAQHSHAEARSITGGFVYRGSRLPELSGHYVYADWITGKMWSLDTATSKPLPVEMATTSVQIICFGETNERELYAVGYEGGIYRIVRNPATSLTHAFPRTLSSTGLFQPGKPVTPAPGVVPYTVATPLWTDGALIDQWIAVPGLEKLGVETRMDRMRGWIRGSWTYPENSVLAKTLSLEMDVGNPATRRRIETQILHYDGASWQAYTYRWKEDQSDAELVSKEGASQTFTVKDAHAPGGAKRIDWRFAARTECMVCHTPKSSTVLGFRAQQLASIRAGGDGGTLLDQFQALGYFQQAPKTPKAPAPPHAAMADLDRRARQYLHVNCSHCHQTGGASAATFDVRDDLAHEKMNLIGMPPTQGALGLHQASIVAPGRPFRSVLLYRMAKEGAGHMPPIGTAAVDPEGLRLMHDWISAMGSPETIKPSTPDTTDPIAMALAKVLELDQSKLSAKARSDAARHFIATHPGGSARDLFERFLPASERMEKLGSNPSPQPILAMAGDPQRGRQIFFSEGGLQCVNCHTIGALGRAIGPDLTKVGAKLSRDLILESLLEPSRVIAPEWVLQTVDARDGSTYSGFVLQRTDAELTLRGVDGNDLHLPMAGIDRLTASQVSLMPEGLLAGLGAQEAADLVAFLAAQK